MTSRTSFHASHPPHSLPPGQFPFPLWARHSFRHKRHSWTRRESFPASYSITSIPVRSIISIRTYKVLAGAPTPSSSALAAGEFINLARRLTEGGNCFFGDPTSNYYDLWTTITRLFPPPDPPSEEKPPYDVSSLRAIWGTLLAVYSLCLCLPACPLACLPASIYLCLSIFLRFVFPLSAYLYITSGCLSVRLYVCLCACVTACLPFCMTTCLSFCLTRSMPVCLCASVSVCHSLCCVYVCLSVCLPASCCHGLPFIRLNNSLAFGCRRLFHIFRSTD